MKKNFIFFCKTFTLITLSSSILQLCNNRLNESNLHIINRAIIILIGLITLILFEKINMRNSTLSNLLIYSISMSLVLLYAWSTGFVEPLHPNAYRDIFLNFTSIFIFIGVFKYIKARFYSCTNEKNKL